LGSSSWAQIVSLIVEPVSVDVIAELLRGKPQYGSVHEY
jgi:hypothetical protein